METIDRKWRAAASDEVLLRNQLRGHFESMEGKINYIYHQFVERSFGSIRLFDVYFFFERFSVYHTDLSTLGRVKKSKLVGSKGEQIVLPF